MATKTYGCIHKADGNVTMGNEVQVDVLSLYLPFTFFRPWPNSLYPEDVGSRFL
jgi:hypothetical protein